MTNEATAELSAAHEAVTALIGIIPDEALDWQPGEGGWSLKQTIGHIAHAYDFYVAIIEQARADQFGTVRLQAKSPGWYRLLAIDAAIAQCASVPAVLERMAQTYQRALAVFEGLTAEELDRSFVFYTWRADAQPEPTTLRRRVLQTAADHLREHRGQLAETFAQWKAAV
jgi:uncharacterized damage-inducible protein DinB